MTLDFQTIPIPFLQGLDTKTHPSQVPIGKLSELENAVFTETGSLNKRNGYNRLDRLILNSVNHISSAKGSAVYNSKDLLLFDGNKTYSYLESFGRWNDRGNCTSIGVTDVNILSNTYQQTAPDVAILNGIELYAWNDSRGGIRYSMIDSVTGSQIVTDKLLSPDGQNPKCLIFGTSFIIIYFTTGGLIVGATIPPANANNPANYSLIADANVTNICFDATTDMDPSAPSLYIAYNTNGGETAVARFDSLFLPEGQTYYEGDANNGITIYRDLFNKYWIGLGRSDSNVYVYATSPTTDLDVPEHQIDTNQVITHITAIEREHIDSESGSGQTIQFYYDINTTSRPYIRTNKVIFANSSYSYDSAVTFKVSVSLASKVWKYNDRIYINCAYDSLLQPTYFTLNDLGEVVSKQNENVAGGFRTPHCLSEIINVSSDNFKYANEKRGTIFSENNLVFTLKGAASSNLNFDPIYRSAMLGNILHLTGGILQQYDGNAVVEHGFNLFPEDITHDPVTNTGSIDDGDHSWQVTYEWTTNTGEIERSAPSPAINIDIENGNLGKVVLTIPALCLTKKQNVRVVIYRTRSSNTGDPLLYRVSSISNPLINDTTAQFVFYTDSASDETIQANDVLYCSPDTTGQLIQLENISAPNCNIITTYKNRIWLAGVDTPNQIWYSKTVVPGEPVAFNDVLTLDMDARGGDITALAVMDSNLIIFKESAIFTLSGVGPTNTGAQNDFIDPQMVASDVGCINAGSVCLVSSEGLFFQSTKGIYLINRSLQTSYVGAPVERYNNQHIVAAAQVPNTTQVRFICSDGNALMYDYFFQQWGTFTNHIAVDAGLWLGSFYLINSSGIVSVEDIGSTTDGDGYINIKITTGWLSFAGLQNYQKARSFLFLGDYEGAHKLNVSAAYDGNENFTDLLTIDTTTLFNPHVYGEQNVYGDNSPYGGTFANEQFRIFIKQQRCQRVKIRIQEQNLNGNRGLTFVAMDFEVGLKKGLGKVKPTQQFGVG